MMIRNRARRLVAPIVIAYFCLGFPVGAGLAEAAVVFALDVPGDPSESYSAPLPATFSEDGLTLHASSSAFQHNNVFSLLFPHMAGGFLSYGFLLTQVPDVPPATLVLEFNADLASFAADFGVLVDFGVVANPTPASLRLDAFSGTEFIGSVVTTPTGGPSIYEGSIGFSVPHGSASFDRVLLTSIPAARDAGTPEFAVDNVRVTVPEPSLLVVLGPALLIPFARGWRRMRIRR